MFFENKTIQTVNSQFLKGCTKTFNSILVLREEMFKLKTKKKWKRSFDKTTILYFCAEKFNCRVKEISFIKLIDRGKCL